jgi:hypothetical protein
VATLDPYRHARAAAADERFDDRAAILSQGVNKRRSVTPSI